MFLHIIIFHTPSLATVIYTCRISPMSPINQLALIVAYFILYDIFHYLVCKLYQGIFYIFDVMLYCELLYDMSFMAIYNMTFIVTFLWHTIHQHVRYIHPPAWLSSLMVLMCTSHIGSYFFMSLLYDNKYLTLLCPFPYLSWPKSKVITPLWHCLWYH